ncbi:sigma-54-dependent transcriptional regulator [Bdellovibrio svalbardensis]|uniref:Sigma-54 dependent transcriptional regulator n=1 Tax=Bdellovibrio svalbardensis TaxID=2972972 RepID=A0ABT6DHR1_9BACT|nr:sigma-54 dependent transcriptional regulator [Bdellovibrio svalbardensis]MDG0816328.1 sigma-54 dependent transcriptional regulator [Bdellovibrio svalbardensis]
MNKIMIIDDEPAMGAMLSDFLKAQNYESVVYASPVEALQNLSEEISLVITDLKMPQMDGMTFIQEALKLHPTLPIILVTAFGSIETAIEATRKGAFHFLTKPLKLNELLVYVEKALHFRNIQRHNLVLKNELRTQHSFAGIIGKSSAMQNIFDLIQRIAPSNANVFIHGDSGTGKELVARALHKLSSRADKAFIAINCTAIPDSLLESELFGHAKGSFTGAHQRKKGLFEEAEGGTIFLDEIGDMDLSLQSKLLRVIQERRVRAVGDNVDKPVDVRIVVATHKDLKTAIRDGRFREDLYYRLSVIPLTLPPLRHRREDIPLLANFFLDKYNAQNGRHISGFTPAAIAQLLNLNWDGNIRELENVIERAVVLCKDTVIDKSDLPDGEANSSESLFAQASEHLPTLEDFEKRYIHFILNKVGGKKEKAAHILGINRRTLYRKEIEYGWEKSPSESEEQES